MASLPPSNNKTILVSGVNGYIATRIADDLLKKGYNVRGSVRNIDSVQPYLDNEWKPYKSRIDIVEVQDMTVSGAFDEAVKGI